MGRRTISNAQRANKSNVSNVSNVSNKEEGIEMANATTTVSPELTNIIETLEILDTKGKELSRINKSLDRIEKAVKELTRKQLRGVTDTNAIEEIKATATYQGMLAKKSLNDEKTVIETFIKNLKEERGLEAMENMMAIGINVGEKATDMAMKTPLSSVITAGITAKTRFAERVAQIASRQ
jgi:hypothetical protein